MIKTFSELQQNLKQRSTKGRIAAVCVYDEATRESLRQAEALGLAEALYIDDEDPTVAAARAVSMVRNHEADILMKGLIGTDQLLRAILNKETGILPPGRVLTHIAVAEVPTYPKLLLFSDAAVIPYPTQEQRIEQVRYMAETCRALGTDEPRIALLHCAEHGGKAFPFVDGYKDIINMAQQGAFGPCIVDGPLDLKTACSAEALAAKRLTSPLEGQADGLILPDIEAGNTLYKALTFFSECQSAGMLCGTSAPVILPSRGDSTDVKFNSILLALASL